MANARVWHAGCSWPRARVWGWYRLHEERGLNSHARQACRAARHRDQNGRWGGTVLRNMLLLLSVWLRWITESAFVFINIFFSCVKKEPMILFIRAWISTTFIKNNLNSETLWKEERNTIHGSSIDPHIKATVLKEHRHNRNIDVRNLCHHA
jgi:hypothetical protein